MQKQPELWPQSRLLSRQSLCVLYLWAREATLPLQVAEGPGRTTLNLSTEHPSFWERKKTGRGPGREAKDRWRSWWPRMACS